MQLNETTDNNNNKDGHLNCYGQFIGGNERNDIAQELLSLYMCDGFKNVNVRDLYLMAFIPCYSMSRKLYYNILYLEMKLIYIYNSHLGYDNYCLKYRGKHNNV